MIPTISDTLPCLVGCSGFQRSEDETDSDGLYYIFKSYSGACCPHSLDAVKEYSALLYVGAIYKQKDENRLGVVLVVMRLALGLILQLNWGSRDFVF